MNVNDLFRVGTGFRVGGTTGINYLIVGMHYKEKFKGKYSYKSV